MNEPRFGRLIVLLLILSLALACCGRPADAGPPAGPSSSPSNGDPAPTAPPPVAVIPARSNLDERFRSEMQPLIDKLETVEEGQPITIEEGEAVVYVPADARVFSVQSILQAGKKEPSLSESRLFILYGYGRGGLLGKKYVDNPSDLNPAVDTQTITTELRLYAQDQGRFYLIQKESGEGGAGSKSYRQLVENAAPPLMALPPELRARVEQELEEIIGYACGIDMNTGLEANRRGQLLALALESSNWADKTQGIRAFRSIDPLPIDLVPTLLPFWTDEAAGREISKILAGLADDPDIYQTIVAYTGSSNPAFRMRAAETLGMLSSDLEMAIDPLVMLAMDHDPNVREAAVTALNISFNTAAKEKLLALLADPVEQTRLRAIEALAGDYSPDEPTRAGLISMLADPSAPVRAAAARALAYKKDDSGGTMESLLAAVKRETDPEALEAELDAVDSFRDEQKTLEAIRLAMSASDSRLRAAAFSRLEYLYEAPGISDIIVAVLGDDDRSLREEASRLAVNMAMMRQYTDSPLSEDEIGEMVAALIIALEDPSREIQANSAQALAYFEGDARAAVPALIKALKQHDDSNDYFFMDALERITGATPGYDAAAWEEWWQENQGQ
jgi:HEAT repeat protein